MQKMNKNNVAQIIEEMDPKRAADITKKMAEK